MPHFHSTMIVLAACLVASSAAAAPTKKECIDANADAQLQQKNGRLKAAKADLLTCTNDTCPGAVKDDCTKRLDALSALIPSIVFEAKDGLGNDLTAVTVTIDGQPLVDHLDGSPFELDPGEHTFAFTTAGAPDIAKTLVISQGERGRREKIAFAAPAGATPTTPPPQLAEPPKEPPPKSSRKTVGIIVGAVGLGGIAAGAIFGGLASSKWSDAKDACSSSSCLRRSDAVSKRSSALGLATGSTIAFIAGGALVVGGVVLWVTAPSTSSAQVGFAGTF